MEKNPRRGGSFKSAFQNRFLLVYGTQGTADENAWMLERARYDAESFWYRGNGSVDVVSDARWRDAAANDRNVILYGNASINAAWEELLADSPVTVAESHWRLADRDPVADSVAVLLIRPRPGSPSALVGAIGGTTTAAMRSTDRIPLYSSGTGYPDVIVTGPDFLQSGPSAVKLAGYFGNNWSFDSGEWAEAHRPD